MPDNIKSILFATILCIVCSLLVTVASTALAPMQTRNMVVDRHKNLLKSVGLVTADQPKSTAEIQSLYEKNIKCLYAEPDGRIIPTDKRRKGDLPVCVQVRDGEIQNYIIPIETRGLWGKIHGYLALENDGATIAGFTVYQHSETPGLGGEIEKNWFQKNFIGKKILNKEGKFVSVSIAKGAVDNRMPQDMKSHYVDGISGATLTGKYLTAGLEHILREYEPVSIRFRRDQVHKVEAQ